MPDDASTTTGVTRCGMAKPTPLEVLKDPAPLEVLKDQRLLVRRLKLGDGRMLRGKADGIHPWQKFVLIAAVTRKQSRYLHITLEKGRDISVLLLSV